jgi:choline/glycine/proline betaine transport protein
MNCNFNKSVFIPATVAIFALVIFSAVFQSEARDVISYLQEQIVYYASWFYVLVVAILMGLCCYLALSRYGDIKLGPDDSTPEYSRMSWFAMLFAAGMGVGLMFFGVAEPVLHFLHPPSAEPQTIAAAKQAMNISFFHWGLSAWSIYAIVGLILAYFGYRHNLPITLRSAFYPIIGKKIYGPIGNLADIFALLGTSFGIATSLGYGVKQVNSGLLFLFDIPVTPLTQITLIIVITVLAAISAFSGVNKGVRILSEFNLIIAALFMVLILFLGPTIYLLQTFVQNTGDYLSGLIAKTFNLYAYQKKHWIGGWTILYWCWWLSWSPFVGMFIARISKGRTIREFLVCVIIIPSLFTLLWMSIFGNAAIYLIMNNMAGNLAEIVEKDSALALFYFLKNFLLSDILSFIAISMLIIFFVTSYDSGAIVLDTLSSKDSFSSPRWQRIYWACVEGLITIVILLVGGLEALQSLTIMSALPFAIILLITCYGLLKALKREERKRELVHSNLKLININTDSEKFAWKNRIDNLLSVPSARKTRDFITKIATPALEEIAKQFQQNNLKVELNKSDDLVFIHVYHGQEIDFIYGIKIVAYNLPNFVLGGTGNNNTNLNKKYFRVEVFLREGSQGRDITGYNQDQIINDCLDQYQSHLHFLNLIR